MASLSNRMRENNCLWLDDYLRDKLRKGDLKRYNNTKRILYYFPTLTLGLSMEDFEVAMSHPDDTYICLNASDDRYKVFDEMYKRRTNSEFKPTECGETRYVTISEVCGDLTFFKNSSE